VQYVAVLLKKGSNLLFDGVNSTGQFE
jgi:hypothetical protein